MSMKEIIRLSGLNPSAFVNDWSSNSRALRTWLESGHLEMVVLEIFDPRTDALVGRWDIDVVYTSGFDDGTFWTDTEQIKYHIRKAGLVPSEAKYRLVLHTKFGRPSVDGWGPALHRSTDGFVRQSLGSTIEHNGLGCRTSYWRRI